MLNYIWHLTQIFVTLNTNYRCIMRQQFYKILFFALFVCTSLAVQAQQNVKYHTVEEGQTLYAIARLYNIQPAELIKLNPQAGDLIRPGDKLRIPANATAQEKGQHDAQQTASGPGAQFVTSSSKVTGQTPCKEMYQIKRKDNLYRIAIEFKLTIEELLAANPSIKESSKLKKGEWLCIPFSKAEQLVENARREAALQTTAATAKQSKKSHLNIAVILPLKENTERGGKMVEFYQGLLMAVDSVRKQGTNIDIYAYHSGNSVADLNTILDKEEMKHMDVVFGPLDGVQANILSNFCKRNKTHLIMPFATTSTYGIDNHYAYIASAQTEQVNQYFANFTVKQFASHNYIQMNCGPADNRGTSFLTKLTQQLATKGLSIRQLDVEGDELSFCSALNQFRNNLIILNSSSSASLQKAVKKLRTFMSQHPEYNISLLGYPEWSTYQGNIVKDLHALDTHTMTTYYRNPSDLRVQAYEQRFSNNFHHELIKTSPRYGILGLDLGYYVLNGMAKLGDYFDERQQTLSYMPLQSPFLFKRLGEDKAFINSNVMLIHYAPSGSINIIK